MEKIMFLASALMATSLSVNASTPVDASLSPLETVVVTATRDESSLKDLLGNTSVVDRETLRLLSHAHVQESLARVPGANLARGNGQEYLPAVRSPVLTGAGACGSVLSAVDGIALRASGFCNINELFEAPTEQADRIEVLRGPGSALHGSNAMSGVINVITPGLQEKSFYSMGMDAGPHDYSKLTLSGGGSEGNQSARADLMLSHDGGYRDDSGFDQQKLLLKHALTAEALTITTTLALANLNQETAGYVVGTDAYKDSDLQTSNPNPEAYRDASSLRLAGSINYLLDDRQHILIQPYFRYTDMDFLQHFLPGNPLEENGHKSVGLQSAYYRDVSDGVQWVAGFDVEYTEGFLKQSQNGPTQGSLFLQRTIPEGFHYDYQVDALMLAPFVQLGINLSEALTVQVGLRYESMRYDYDNKMLSGRTDQDGVACGFGGCRYSRPADRKDDFDNWSPKVGLLYHLSDNQQAYVNLSRGFRAPQATELYRLQREQVVADLDSEVLNSIELGLRGVEGNLAYELIAYWMDKKNIIFRDSDYYNVADGATDHLGLELALNYKLSDNVDLAVSASYAEHTYDDKRELNGVPIDGNWVDSAPKHFGSVRLGWNFSEQGRAELEWVKQSAYYTDPENLHRYDGHSLLHLRSRLKLNEHVSVSARVTNLTDTDYAERADFSGFAGDRYFPGESRALHLGVAMDY